MKLYIKLLLLSFAIPFCTYATNEIDKYATLPIVYGWSKNVKSDKWSTKEKEIKDIDKFDEYYIFSYHISGKKYVAFSKQTKEKSFRVFTSYVIDFENYREQITRWDEKAVLKFPILKKTVVKLTKAEEISLVSLQLDEAPNSVTRDQFVIQYRFEVDSSVKFLLYTELCNSDTCVTSGLEAKDIENPSMKVVGSDNLFTNFFYKTMREDFVKFTDLPLN